MAVRLEKPWIDLNASNVAKVAGHLGVYELANKNDEIVYICLLYTSDAADE